MGPLTRPCLLLLLLGRLSLLALPLLLGTCLSSLWSPPFPSRAPTLISPSLIKVRCSLTLILSPITIWYSGLMALFLIPSGKGGSGILAYSSYCGTEATLSFSAARICSSFSAEACTIPHALCWSLQHQKVCCLSSLLLLSDSFCPLLHLSFYLELCGRSGRNCLFSPPVLYVTVGLGHSFLLGNNAANELARRGVLFAPSAIPCSLSPLISCIHSSPFSDWRCTVSLKFFDTQVLSIFTEELVLPDHARCVLSRLRCNGHSLLLSSCLSTIGRIENSSCSACRHSSQDTSHLILHCPCVDSLCCSPFGDSLSLYNIWSRPWKIARLLGLHGLPPCLHPSKGVW